MICPHCGCHLVLFRLGRAHLACIECGKDVTLHLICMRDAGIDLSGLVTMTPEDFRP